MYIYYTIYYAMHLDSLGSATISLTPPQPSQPELLLRPPLPPLGALPGRQPTHGRSGPGVGART